MEHTSFPSPSARRSMLRRALQEHRLLRFPGAFSPFVALLIEKAGFDGVYVSGAGVANDLGYPDIGLTTLTEVTSRGAAIAARTRLPAIIDADTGFGEPIQVARTVTELVAAGLAGMHLEDQENPKRCGHLDGKALVPAEVMVRKIRAAVTARPDPDFLVFARTDARAVEGLDAAIDRARAYVDAGADGIFPEALQSEAEFAAFRKAIDVPLMANMTEFGKSPLLSADTLQDLGYDIVIYPMTAFRVAMKAVEDALQDLARHGSQAGLLDRMQTRARLYEVLGYDAYARLDAAWHAGGAPTTGPEHRKGG